MYHMIVLKMLQKHTKRCL